MKRFGSVREEATGAEGAISTFTPREKRVNGVCSAHYVVSRPFLGIERGERGGERAHVTL